MHSHDLSAFAHRHAFGDAGARQRERALAAVTAITLLTMVAELVAGYWSGSLALTADGWHMGTHALALGGAVLAYRLSARASGHAAYAFGGWKIEVLSAYSSGLLLMAVALWLVFDSIAALRAPHAIAYGEAMAVAVIGLAVNVASAWLLARGARRGHGEHEHHDQGAAHARPCPTTIITTTISAPPMCMCWPTPSPRCSPSARSPAGSGSAGAGSIRRSHWSARR